MSIRQFRPMTAATRFRSVSGFDEITQETPHKPLTRSKKRISGRNNQGRVTVRHSGGAQIQKQTVRHFHQQKLLAVRHGEQLPGPPLKPACWLAIRSTLILAFLRILALKLPM